MRFHADHVGDFSAGPENFDPIFAVRRSQVHIRRGNPTNAKPPQFVLASRALLA
jgi:hypothetical protein